MTPEQSTRLEEIEAEWQRVKSLRGDMPVRSAAQAYFAVNCIDPLLSLITDLQRENAELQRTLNAVSERERKAYNDSFTGMED